MGVEICIWGLHRQVALSWFIFVMAGSQVYITSQNREYPLNRGGGDEFGIFHCRAFQSSGEAQVNLKAFKCELEQTITFNLDKVERLVTSI